MGSSFFSSSTLEAVDSASTSASVSGIIAIASSLALASASSRLRFARLDLVLLTSFSYSFTEIFPFFVGIFFQMVREPFVYGTLFPGSDMLCP